METNIDHNDYLDFSTLFESYYPKLCYFASRYLKNRPDAEDLVQSVFARLWARRTKLPDQTITLSYLYIAVRHAIMNFQRDKQSHLSIEREDYVASFDDPFKTIVSTETFHLIHRALEELPQKCQEVVRQCLLEETDTNQIAQSLRCTVSTVRNQKAKGLQALRKQLQHLRFLLFF